MRRYSHQRSALATRFEHQMQVPVLEIPDTTMNEPRRSTRRSAREIIALDECGPKSPHRGVTRYPGAVDPAPNDEHVELLAAESPHAIGSRDVGARDARRALMPNGELCFVEAAHR